MIQLTKAPNLAQLWVIVILFILEGVPFAEISVRRVKDNLILEKKNPALGSLWGKSVKFFFKDGACYCYCANVLRISRYSDFLSVMLTNTGIFLRGTKLSGESRSYQVLLVSKKKIEGNHAFFRDN